MTSVVIIGTGLAGYNLAREIRKRSSDTLLTLVTRDDGAFYSKPMLSNALQKQKSPSELPMADADKMCSDLDATILTHTHVTSVQPQAMTIELDTGELLKYDKLVMATGAEPIFFPMQGEGVDDVLVVNNLADYTRFRSKLEDCKSVAIIGPGLIGCEFANDLAPQGYKVSIIGPDRAPMGNLLPPEAGEVLQTALSKLGVDWHLERTVRAIHKLQNGYQLVLDDDQKLTADLVLSATGLRADTSLADDIGLDCQRGIVVNRYLQTSDENIYALGDCAEVDGLFLPFVMPLMNAARALAATLCGEPTKVSYPAMPVLVKTPAMTTIVAPPERDAQGEWIITPMDNGIKALYKQDDALLGFVLMGDAASEKQALTKELSPVLV